VDVGVVTWDRRDSSSSSKWRVFELELPEIDTFRSNGPVLPGIRSWPSILLGVLLLS